MSARRAYVAIFMDCEMPDIDGYTVARQMRTREGRNAHTPVIAVTADWLDLVGCASGVQEIVGLADLTRPHVVVIDWMMLGGGGPEASRQILARHPDTLIIGLTSSDNA